MVFCKPALVIRGTDESDDDRIGYQFGGVFRHAWRCIFPKANLYWFFMQQAVFQRLALISSVALLCHMSFFGANAVADDNPMRPNIVLIMADDLGFSDLGCYGGEIRTPYLDGLAREGMQFTQFYNCAVCVTTRAALLTGLHPRRREKNRLLHEDMMTLAEVLRSAGYRTSLTGKWHLGATHPNRPTDRGFDEYYGVASGCCNFFDPSLPDPVFYNGGKRRPFLHNETSVTEFSDNYYTTDAFTEHAVQQIHKSKVDNRPYFLHVCYTAPHFPLHAKPEDIGRYRGRYDAGYFQLREKRYRRQVELGLIRPGWQLSKPDRRLGEFRYDYDITPWNDVEDLAREKRRMEVYAAMVDSMDQGIGRILKAIDESGHADNTLVMFLSDNGGCASFPGYSDEKQRAGRVEYNKELPGGINTYDFVAPGWGWAQCTPFRRYKVWTYEGGIATPMIARWPRAIASGSRTDQIGHVVDFMPTVLELSGAKYPTERSGNTVLPIEGRSLVPILQGKTRKGHESICWYLYGNRAVRQGRWKLVWGVTAQKWELYDMQTDRTETTNVASLHPELVEQLKTAWRQWAKQTGVPLKGSSL